MLKDNIIFLKEGITEFKHTGTLFPTTRWAADGLIWPLRRKRGAMRILELGPGTGSVTNRIIENMIDGDELVICEINPRFMEALKERLEEREDFQQRRHQISFFLGAAQELPEVGSYDLIVCALPFLNFDLKTVEEIFAKLHRLSTSQTVMTYYEYMGMRAVGKMFSSAKRKRRLNDIDSFYRRNLYPERLMHRRPVWLNVLPINVYALKMAV
jgi:phosphatidylethanolamine/phosphatidyl-N-methylethanolamine N-methyltransferase